MAKRAIIDVDMKDNVKREYTKEWIQYDRPQPMYSSDINKFYDNFYQHNPVHTPDLDQQFKDTFVQWLKDHKYSTFTGLDAFPRHDIINGCTQYIDDLYQRCGTLQTFKDDYKYHWRLNNNIEYATVDTLDTNKELLIAMPFPFHGDVHPDMTQILDTAYELNIPVHIDGAWISCIRDIEFNFDHPAIHTVGISLSKGGMGGNRIGLRFARSTPKGAVTIMNDFNMNSQATVSMGIKFMEELGPEYFWNSYSEAYAQVLKDFNLQPTKAIHLARQNSRPVGIRSLLRCIKK
jgi:alanine-alpha-ketoisovalerate/valine-pyruvate aminotransferase